MNKSLTARASTARQPVVLSLMTEASALSYLRDPRLASNATSLAPVWVWSADGTRVLWANAVAVALLGAASLAQLRAQRFATNEKPASHVVLLAGSLPENGAARLERMRGFGTGFFRLLTCTCSRLALGDGNFAILIISTEQAGPALSLADRAQRLLEGSDEPIAAFGTDGTLLFATPNAAKRMASATTLMAFDAQALAAEALANGSSAGRTLVGPTSLLRAGENNNSVLIASFATPLDARYPMTSPPLTPGPAEEATALEAFRKKLAAAGKSAQVGMAPIADPQADAAGTQIAAVEAHGAEARTIDAPGQPATDRHPEAAEPVAEPAVPGAEQVPPATAVSSSPAPTASPHDLPRPHPLRFVWQMDGDEHFSLTSDEFLHLAGPSTRQVLGKSWDEINAALQLDKDGRVARAIATRDTWSGLVLSWPVDGATQRLTIELSGLPIYDRQRSFGGYRGFGVCRDLEALTAVARQRRAAALAVAAAPPAAADVFPQAAASETAQVAPAEPPIMPEQNLPPAASDQTSDAPAPRATPGPHRQVITFIGPSQNVVPFRVAPVEPRNTPGLNAGERNTFTEIARQLSARLKGDERRNIAPQHDEDSALALHSSPAAPADSRAPAIEPPQAASATPAEPKEEAAHEPAPAATPAVALAAANDQVAAEVQASEPPTWFSQSSDARSLLDRLPLGVLVYRFETMLYANRTFLDGIGYQTLAAFSEAGGIDSLFIETSGSAPGEFGSQTLTITTSKGDKLPVEGRLFSVPWNGDNALALVLLGPRMAQDPVRETTKQQAPTRDDSELRARLQTLEQELAEARRVAEATSKDRNELLGKIGKEVRAPIASIIGYVEGMLSERYGPIGNERYRTFLTDIHYSGSRMLALFDDLASLSKIERGRPYTEAPSINLNEIVQACVTQMQPEASRVRVLIRSSLANPLPAIAAEQDSVRQVVLNLLSNSIRFAGAGGQVIVSSAATGDGKVLLRLRDTGPGLSASDLARLQSNGQGSPSADAADQQLTLAVARALLEANHAALAVTSKPDEGTLVEVLFQSAR